MGRVSPGEFLLELDKLYAKQKAKGSVYVEMKRGMHCLTLLVLQCISHRLHFHTPSEQGLTCDNGWCSKLPK